MKPSALAVLLLLGASAAFAQHPGQKVIHPNELKWSDVPTLPPGAKIAVIEGPMYETVPYTVRLRFPPNYQIPAHWHPATERVTVLAGTLNMGAGNKLDRKNGTALSPGSMSIMLAKTPYYVWTGKQETIVQLHGTGPWGIVYVDPADDPRKK